MCTVLTESPTIGYSQQRASNFDMSRQFDAVRTVVYVGSGSPRVRYNDQTHDLDEVADDVFEMRFDQDMVVGIFTNMEAICDEVGTWIVQGVFAPSHQREQLFLEEYCTSVRGVPRLTQDSNTSWNVQDPPPEVADNLSWNLNNVPFRISVNGMPLLDVTHEFARATEVGSFGGGVPIGPIVFSRIETTTIGEIPEPPVPIPTPDVDLETV